MPARVWIAERRDLNRHDPAALDPLLDAESVRGCSRGLPWRGPDQIKAFAGEVFKAQPDLKWRLTTIVVSGSTVAAENGPVKAQKILAHGATFAVVVGGRIRRFVDYYDFASAFPALRPLPGRAGS